MAGDRETRVEYTDEDWQRLLKEFGGSPGRVERYERRLGWIAARKARAAEFRKTKPRKRYEDI